LELVAIAAAQTAFEKARLARVMWSAFQCATYADYAQDNSERARLIEIGLKAGREFLEAAKAGQITPEAGNAEVPEVIMPFLGGPSVDFALGRIFESSINDAADEIIKKRNGLYLQSTEWVTDESLQKSKAQTEFQKGNCKALR
jgi:hypothetical protein